MRLPSNNYTAAMGHSMFTYQWSPQFKIVRWYAFCYDPSTRVHRESEWTSVTIHLHWEYRA